VFGSESKEIENYLASSVCLCSKAYCDSSCR